jgi:hypothetical protein
MSDQPIAPEVIEAARQAMKDRFMGGARYADLVEAAIRAADLARGLTVEERGDRPGIRRLVGPWVPVGGEA